jgi:hypothetical protein
MTTDSPQAQPPNRIWLPKRALSLPEPPYGYKESDGTWYSREDLPRAAADDAGLFKNVCRIHTEWTIDRYLMSNAVNSLDPAEKAQRHIELCQFYVAAVRGCSRKDAMSDYEEDFDRLHEESQKLTSSLDTEIGFPLDRTPDYADLNPKFFERFHAIACRALATPRVETGLTVEAALVELRELFPQRSLIVSAFARPDEYSIAVASEDEYELFSYDTLDQCLAEVRSWGKSTQNEKVNHENK